MRKILLAFATILAVTACRSHQIKEASALTDTFLTAYCSRDFDSAASLCEEPLKSQILKASDILSEQDTLVSTAADSILKNIRWKKSLVETEEETDDVVFTCTTSYLNQTLSYTITLTPIEKGWLISEIK